MKFMRTHANPLCSLLVCMLGLAKSLMAIGSGVYCVSQMGPSIKDVHKILAFFHPFLCPSTSTFANPTFPPCDVHFIRPHFNTHLSPS